MNSSTSRLPLVAFCVLLSNLFLPLLQGAAAGRSPFIERVKPEDFFDAENEFPEIYSRAYDLVILRTTAAKPVSALAIRHGAENESYTLTLHLASADAPDGWLKIGEELDADVAKQILRAVEFKLHRQVALSDFKRTMSKTDSDLWIFQRRSDNRATAALISTEASLGNAQATAFIADFIGSIQRLIGTEGAARNELLQKIDRASTEIILAESP